jgi:hypothetical protein
MKRAADEWAEAIADMDAERESGADPSDPRSQAFAAR